MRYELAYGDAVAWDGELTITVDAASEAAAIEEGDRVLEDLYECGTQPSEIKCGAGETIGPEVVLYWIDEEDHPLYHDFWGVVRLPAGVTLDVLPKWYAEWEQLPEEEREEFTDWLCSAKGCVERKDVGYCVFPGSNT